MRTVEPATDPLVAAGSSEAGLQEPRHAIRVRVLPEAALVVGLWLVYNAGRFVAARHTGRAVAHATSVWQLERRLRLPDEVDDQHFVLTHGVVVVRFANDYYRWVHLPLTVVVLVLLLRFRPAAYLWVRTAMAYATAAALVIHIVYPVAPPRMLPRLGFVDTGLRFGQSVYGPRGHDHLANEFAAMPSLHVGWAVLLAVAVIASFRTPWRWAALVHPVLTALVVVVTANHFWLDGVAGTVLALAGLALAARAPRDPGPDVTPRKSASWRMSARTRPPRLVAPLRTVPDRKQR